MTATGRSVVIHADDLGMTHGANQAFLELARTGICSSGSVMVPCPWFAEAAAIAADDPSLDVGVHLTLTSEQKPVRWRPLTAPPPAAGMTDDCGYFWPDVPKARRAAPEAVETELRTQVDAAFAAGMHPTHLDAHMGTALMPEFTAIYRRIGRDYGLPIMLVRKLLDYNPASYAGPIDHEAYEAEVALAHADRQPVFDRVLETPWTRTDDAATAYRKLLSGIPEGLSFLALHFNRPGDFEAIDPIGARIRTEEYALFASGIVAEWIRELGLTVVGMRAFRDELRAKSV